MRAALTIVIALAAVAVPLDRAMAFPGSKARAKATAPTTRPADPLKAMYGRVMQELNLPADKAPKVQEILDDDYKTLTAWIAKVNPEVDKLRAQMKVIHGSTNPKTIEQVKAAMKRYNELLAEMKVIRSSVFEPLGKVLSPEQLAAAKAILLPQPKPSPRTPMPDNPFHLLAKVNLTEEQTARIGKIMEALNANEKDPAAKAKSMAVLWDRIVKDVLTDEQRTQLDAASAEAARRRMVLGSLGGLTLTNEQMAKVDAIWKVAYGADSKAKTPAARIDIYTTALDKITNEVLTDEQRKQLKSGRGGAAHAMPPKGMGR